MSFLWQRIKLIVALLVLMIAIHVASGIMGGALLRFGVVPGDVSRWWHIFTAPFIHGDNSHLFNNLVGLAIFSGFCLIRSLSFFWLSSLFIISLTGGLVWFFGRDALHIGASGWIFGLWSLTIAMACFDRRMIHILAGLLVCFLYGGMIYGVLPTDPRISFESHFFGAISGVLCAFLYAKFFRNTK